MKWYTAIPWYEGLYEINEEWAIMSIERYDRFNKKVWWHHIKWYINNNWYKCIDLYFEWKRKKFLFHRLVMLTFMWESELDVNHKDWDKTNNSLVNLEYCTKSHNMKHYFNELWWKRESPSKWKFWKDNHLSKKINQYDLNWVFIKEWDSMASIHRWLWILASNVSNVCRWVRKTAKWFIFKYA